MSRQKNNRRRFVTAPGLGAETLESRAMLSVSPFGGAVSRPVIGDLGIATEHREGAAYTSGLTNDTVSGILMNSVGPALNLSPLTISERATSPRVAGAINVGLQLGASDFLTNENPEMIGTLASIEMIEQAPALIGEPLYNDSLRYMEPPMTELTQGIEDVYTNMLLGSMYYSGADGMTGGEIGTEVAGNTAEEIVGMVLGAVSRGLSTLFGVFGQVSDYSETGAQGVTAVCEHRDHLNEQFEEIDGMEGDSFEDCEEMVKPKDDSTDSKDGESDEDDSDNSGDESEDCFPPIVYETLTQFVEPLIPVDAAFGQDAFEAFATPMNEIQQAHVGRNLVSALAVRTYATQQQVFAHWF